MDCTQSDGFVRVDPDESVRVPGSGPVRIECSAENVADFDTTKFDARQPTKQMKKGLPDWRKE